MAVKTRFSGQYITLKFPVMHGRDARALPCESVAELVIELRDLAEN